METLASAFSNIGLLAIAVPGVLLILDCVRSYLQGLAHERRMAKRRAADRCTLELTGGLYDDVP